MMANRTHGMTLTSEYMAWQSMLKRCYKTYNTDYRNYGGRGITVCDRWRNSFEDFYADMGTKPSAELTLERIDVNGNYELSNCCWASRSAQMFNRRTKAFNAKLTAMQVEEIRHRYIKGETQRGLAAQFSVSKSQIGNIIRNEAWTV